MNEKSLYEFKPFSTVTLRLTETKNITDYKVNQPFLEIVIYVWLYRISEEKYIINANGLEIYIA